jgi:hypothetical protein
MSITAITALYDIERETKGDGRSISEYLDWFKETLKLNINLVIYTEKKFESFINENRINNKTKLIIKPLNEIPYYKYKTNIENIIYSKEYKHKMMANDRVECVLPLYNIIQYSKFDWIQECIDNKYFDTDYYFWMDAGISRFFDGIDLQNWPNNYSLLQVEKINIQGNINTLLFNKNWPGDDQYIWNCNTMLCGGLFGGGKPIMTKLSHLVKNKFEYYLNNLCINNEQIILGILWKNNPNLFNIHFNLNGKPLPFLKDMA